MSDAEAQLPKAPDGGTLWWLVPDPLDIAAEDHVERLSLDLSAADAAFLRRFAAYRNEVAKGQGLRLKMKWSRKSLAEAFIAAQIAEAKRQLEEMFSAVGELPAEDDHEALAAYVKKVIRWSERKK